MDKAAQVRELYVRMVDGTLCYAPLPASQNADGTFRLLANAEFDPEDTGTLLEFLPGDNVLSDGGAPVLLAT